MDDIRKQHRAIEKLATTLSEAGVYVVVVVEDIEPTQAAEGVEIQTRVFGNAPSGVAISMLEHALAAAQKVAPAIDRQFERQGPFQ